jgi:hypothetical protein
LGRSEPSAHAHLTAAIIDKCESPDLILALFKEQSRAFYQFRNGDRKLIDWLTPVVNGLHAISTNTVISTGASFASPFQFRIPLPK